MKTNHALVLLLALGSLSGCKSPYSGSELPPGKGLLSFDREAPAGVETFARPTWRAGDRLVYRIGHQSRVAFRVEADGEGWRLAQEGGGSPLRLDADLGDLGEAPKEGEKHAMTFDPVDSRYSWPLWDGKRWSCQFVIRPADRVPVSLQAEYEVQGEEVVEVPAGKFRCLRIWRTRRPSVEGKYIDRVDISWYAPEVGYYVRRLDDGVLTELEEFQRQ